jgi:hypothetical protein
MVQSSNRRSSVIVSRQIKVSQRTNAGAAAAYAGAAAAYAVTAKIRLTQPQVELETWAELGNKMFVFYISVTCVFTKLTIFESTNTVCLLTLWIFSSVLQTV